MTAGEFLAKFPPLLKRLRLGCIHYWPIVFRDMLAMAERHARLPKLGFVMLEVSRISTPPREEFDCLVEAFRNEGSLICFLVRDPFSRGPLPARPGLPVLLLEPLSYT